MRLNQLTFESQSIYDLHINDEVWIGNSPHFVKQFSRGGMGLVVFLRRDDSRSHDPGQRLLYGPDVAIKAVLQTGDSNDFRDLFERELVVWSGLIHPNVVRLLEILETRSDGLVASMIRSPGSLRSFLDKRGSLSISDALWIADDVASGLEYAISSHGTLHLDIKPANILFSYDMRRMMEHDSDPVRRHIWQVSDWGLASVREIKLADLLSQRFPTDTAVTFNNLGTFAYMAPERFEHGVKSSVASDMYALGLLLYEMIIGELPYASESLDVVTQIRSLSYYRWAKAVLVSRGISKNVQQVILQLLSPDPVKRFSSYKELRAQFKILMRPPSMLSRIFKR